MRVDSRIGKPIQLGSRMRLSRTLEKKFEGHTVVEGGKQILKCLAWDNMAGWWPAGAYELDWHILTTLVAAGESMARLRQTCNWRGTGNGQILRKHEAKLSFSALDIESLRQVTYLQGAHPTSGPVGMRIQFNRFIEVERHMILPFTQEITDGGIEVTFFDVWTPGVREAFELTQVLERWMRAARQKEPAYEEDDFPSDAEKPSRFESPGETRR